MKKKTEGTMNSVRMNLPRSFSIPFHSMERKDIPVINKHMIIKNHMHRKKLEDKVSKLNSSITNLENKVNSTIAYNSGDFECREDACMLLWIKIDTMTEKITKMESELSRLSV